MSPIRTITPSALTVAALAPAVALAADIDLRGEPSLRLVKPGTVRASINALMGGSEGVISLPSTRKTPRVPVPWQHPLSFQ